MTRAAFLAHRLVDLWVDNGKSAPVAMDTMSIDIVDSVFGDMNGDGLVNGADLGLILSAWGLCSDCTEDLNGDGTVSGADLGLFLTSWGNSPCAADLNGDGTCNGADLGVLLSAWGDC